MALVNQEEPVEAAIELVVVVQIKEEGRQQSIRRINYLFLRPSLRILDVTCCTAQLTTLCDTANERLLCVEG